MFPHTITIYHHSVVSGADSYTKTVLDGAYWHHTQAQSGAGHGAERTDSYTIVMSPEQTAAYGTGWNAYVGDRVVKGVGGAITSFKDIADAMVIKSIQENICGSCVDNVTLNG